VNFRRLLCLLITIPAMAQSANVGLKITIRDLTNGRQTMQETQYVQGDRRREEHRIAFGSNYGPSLALITRCDMGQNFDLNLEDKQYVSTPIPKVRSAAEWQALAAKYSASAGPRTPTILIEITTVDTGERKNLFGYEARHVIATEKHTRLNGAKDVEQESVKDGWFADLPTSLSCYPKSRGAVSFATARSKNEPVDVPSLKLVGSPEAGFALSMTTTSHFPYSLPDGSKRETTSTSQQEVTELFSGPLDAQLFEVPRGFTKVDHLRRDPPVPLLVRAQEYWNSLKQKISRLFS
jgi:hypothetical protein